MARGLLCTVQRLCEEQDLLNVWLLDPLQVVGVQFDVSGPNSCGIWTNVDRQGSMTGAMVLEEAVARKASRDVEPCSFASFCRLFRCGRILWPKRVSRC